MRRALSVIALLWVGYASASSRASDLAFDTAQLAGSWVESVSVWPVCRDDPVRFRFEFAPDGKSLKVRLSRTHQTQIGSRDVVEASIVEATPFSLTISYVGETRKRADGTPQQWQLIVVAPGVYRWRETSWAAHVVNSTVGIRCGD
jgi:hypothetical protein